MTGRTLFRAVVNTMDPKDRKFAEDYVKEKQMAYLCLPFDGDPDLYQAKVECLIPWFERENYALFAPYLSMVQMEEMGVSFTREQAEDVALCMIDTCDVFIVVRDYLTPNVLEELIRALRQKKRIIYLDEPDEEEANE